MKGLVPAGENNPLCLTERCKLQSGTIRAVKGFIRARTKKLLRTVKENYELWNVKFAVWKKTTLLFTHTLTKCQHTTKVNRNYTYLVEVFDKHNYNYNQFFFESAKKINPKKQRDWSLQKNCTTSTLLFPSQHKKTSLLQKTDQNMKKHNYTTTLTKITQQNLTQEIGFSNLNFGFSKFSNLNNEVPEMCFRLPAQAASDYPHKVPSNNGVYKKLFPTSNCPNTCTANPPEPIVS